MSKKKLLLLFQYRLQGIEMFLKCIFPRSVILYFVFGFRSINDLETEMYFSRSRALIFEARFPSEILKISFSALNSYPSLATNIDII